MNKAVAFLTLSVEEFNTAKPFVDALGGAYKSNYDAKFAEARDLLAKSIDENKKIYYEPNIPSAEVEKPDPQNFVNLLSMSEQVNQVN